MNPFKELPEAICDLYYPETFDISYCSNLWCLLERIEDLVNLRHLFNFDTSESLQMPQGFKKLISLCTLTGFIARNNSNNLAILKDLNQLERLDVYFENEVDFGSAEFGKKIHMREMSCCSAL
ncbi:putative disease resistance RPP13-like protein 1, partial [Coffea eugenioides]|uniref:putative disease resistance RPP13-like protein 1 n=1 Tax=Coffea eugenioides TaxID=49369 RepID=UPI000F605CA6